jgi:type IV pilus assembly protein PilC
MLIKSGVPIVEALRIVAKSLSNIWFQELIFASANEVTKGKSITIPLSKSKIFPVIMLKMLATGEETGKLDQITEDMADYYEREVDDLTSNLTKLLEPFILLLVGGMVAFMAVAIYLPLYDLGQAAAM